MRKFIVMIMAILAVLSLAGCGEGSTSAEDKQNSGNSTTINAGGDVVITDVEVTGEGTYIQTEGDVIYVAGDYNADGANAGDEAAEYDPDAYDATYSQSECTANGFFFCTLANKCLNQPLKAGSCTQSQVLQGKFQ